MILAILGRGIQKLDEKGPWFPTDDLEMCDWDSGHLAIRIPPDDNDPRCMIGGGALNFYAGCIAYEKLMPNAVVCAYGHRSDYLVKADAPSESEVMSAMIKQRYPDAPVIVWQRDNVAPGPSNTNRELRNIFELALAASEMEVRIVTCRVHMPRTMELARRHLAEWMFNGMVVNYHPSEEIISEEFPDGHGGRSCEALLKSKAFARTWEREQAGIFRILTNAYGDAKPPIDPRAAR